MSGIIVSLKTIRNIARLLDLADLALQEQPEDDKMVHISQALYSGSYTMAIRPIKSLGLHYTMIQFLKKSVISTPDNNFEYKNIQYRCTILSQLRPAIAVFK